MCGVHKGMKGQKLGNFNNLISFYVQRGVIPHVPTEI